MAHLAQSTSSPSSSSSYFDRLPLELVKVVVGMVHAQDQAFKKCESVVAGLDIHGEEEAVDILGGRWSKWYGKGLVALALTSKLCRTAAFPLMCQTVTVKQLAAPYFRFKLVRDAALCGMIRHVNFRAATMATLVDAASVLYLLPAVEHVTFRGYSHEVHNALSCAEEDVRGGQFMVHALAGKEIFALVARVAEATIAVAEAFAPFATSILQRVTPSLFRRLSLEPPPHDPFSLRYPQADLLVALQELDELESLSIHDQGAYDEDYAVDASWQNGLKFDSLSHLTLLVGEAYTSFCNFASQVAPNLRRLKLLEIEQAEPAVPPRFLHLQHVNLSGPVASDAIDEFASTPLETMIVRVESMYDFACSSIISDRHFPSSSSSTSSFPSSLRTLICNVRSPIRPDDIPEYTEKFAAMGIDFRYTWTPNPYYMGSARGRTDYPQAPYARWGEESWRRAAVEALDWARDRVLWAGRTGDDRSVDEVIMAVLRLRERQVIEMQ